MKPSKVLNKNLPKLQYRESSVCTLQISDTSEIDERDNNAIVPYCFKPTNALTQLNNDQTINLEDQNFKIPIEEIHCDQNNQSNKNQNYINNDYEIGDSIEEDTIIHEISREFKKNKIGINEQSKEFTSNQIQKQSATYNSLHKSISQKLINQDHLQYIKNITKQLVNQNRNLAKKINQVTKVTKEKNYKNTLQLWETMKPIEHNKLSREFELINPLECLESSERIDHLERFYRRFQIKNNATLNYHSNNKSVFSGIYKGEEIIRNQNVNIKKDRNHYDKEMRLSMLKELALEKAREDKFQRISKEETKEIEHNHFNQKKVSRITINDMMNIVTKLHDDGFKIKSKKFQSFVEQKFNNSKLLENYFHPNINHKPYNINKISEPNFQERNLLVSKSFMKENNKRSSSSSNNQKIPDKNMKEVQKNQKKMQKNKSINNLDFNTINKERIIKCNKKKQLNFKRETSQLTQSSREFVKRKKEGKDCGIYDTNKLVTFQENDKYDKNNFDLIEDLNELNIPKNISHNEYEKE